MWYLHLTILFQNLSLKGLKVSVARCFAFVGEFLPLNSHFVIGNIIRNILDKQKIIINAKYDIVRSYMYSDDLVKWLIKILENSDKTFKVYNLGSNDNVSVKKIASFLAKKYKLEAVIPKNLSKKKDYYIPDISKAMYELNLKINYSSKESILKTINLLSQKIN